MKRYKIGDVDRPLRARLGRLRGERRADPGARADLLEVGGVAPRALNVVCDGIKAWREAISLPGAL